MSDGASSPAEPAEPDPLASVLAVLDLAASDARTTEDIFTRVSLAMPIGRVFGGQVLAQSIVAASRTTPEGRAPHSMHAYFLRAGDAAQGITFSVDRIHDGRSFSTRRTQAFQNGVPIFSMIASFQDEGAGLEHQAPMPEGIPAPEDLAPDGVVDMHPMWMRMSTDRPLDLRHVPSSALAEGAHGAVWMRTRGALPDDPAIHRAALAYLSDLTIQGSVLRAHGVAWTADLKIASLDHAMWWHRDGRVDDWLLYVHESPSARGGRGLAQGQIYTRYGTLLASVAQEIMVRVPAEG